MKRISILITGSILFTSCSFNNKKQVEENTGLHTDKRVCTIYEDNLDQPYYAPINDSLSICYIQDTIKDLRIGLYFKTDIDVFDVKSTFNMDKDVLSRIEKDSGILIVNNNVIKLEGDRQYFPRLYPMQLFVIDSGKTSKVFIDIPFVSYLRDQWGYCLVLKLDSAKNVTDQKMVYTKEHVDLKYVLDSLNK